MQITSTLGLLSRRPYWGFPYQLGADTADHKKSNVEMQKYKPKLQWITGSQHGRCKQPKGSWVIVLKNNIYFCHENTMRLGGPNQGGKLYYSFF